MIIHIGGQRSLKEEEIVMILDIDTAATTESTKKLMARLEKEKKVVSSGEDLPKSVVIAQKGREERCYLSPVSARTIMQRIEEGKVETNWKKS